SDQAESAHVRFRPVPLFGGGCKSQSAQALRPGPEGQSQQRFDSLPHEHFTIEYCFRGKLSQARKGDVVTLAELEECPREEGLSFHAERQGGELITVAQ